MLRAFAYVCLPVSVAGFVALPERPCQLGDNPQPALAIHESLLGMKERIYTIIALTVRSERDGACTRTLRGNSIYTSSYTYMYKYEGIHLRGKVKSYSG